MFKVVAPALITSVRSSTRKSLSERPASSGENSISSTPRDLIYLTAATDFSIHCFLVIFNLFFK